MVFLLKKMYLSYEIFMITCPTKSERKYTAKFCGAIFFTCKKDKFQKGS